MLNKPTSKELKQLHTSESIHGHMKYWAKQFEQKPLRVETIFYDGTSSIEEFEPAQKEVFYPVWCEDNEKYSVNVDKMGKFVYNYGEYDMSHLGKTAIVKAQKAWLDQVGIEFESITVIGG